MTKYNNSFSQSSNDSDTSKTEGMKLNQTVDDAASQNQKHVDTDKDSDTDNEVSLILDKPADKQSGPNNTKSDSDTNIENTKTVWTVEECFELLTYWCLSVLVPLLGHLHFSV